MNKFKSPHVIHMSKTLKVKANDHNRFICLWTEVQLLFNILYMEFSCVPIFTSITVHNYPFICLHLIWLLQWAGGFVFILDSLQQPFFFFYLGHKSNLHRRITNIGKIKINAEKWIVEHVFTSQKPLPIKRSIKCLYITYSSLHYANT